jgi:YHS domain-containing protein
MANATDRRIVNIDPVSHEEVDPDQAAGRSYYRGRTYHFATLVNKRTFDDDPQLWIPTPHASMNSANIDIEDY